MRATSPAAGPPRSRRPRVGVLGFVFPDRGYEHVLAALPHGRRRWSALGRAAAGHEDLLERYARPGRRPVRASPASCRTPSSRDQLAAVAVPVAPNRRVTASALDQHLAGARPPPARARLAVRARAARRTPGALELYDPTTRATCASAIAAALADPCRDQAGGRRPGRPDARRGRPARTASTSAPAGLPPRPATAGGAVVPGNRWDLLPRAERTPAVSVVVPYYDAQRDLDLVLAALGRADARPARGRRRRRRLAVPRPTSGPPGDAGPRRCARTTGASAPPPPATSARRAARGEVLVFLDGDTVPEPAFVARLAARWRRARTCWPSAAAGTPTSPVGARPASSALPRRRPAPDVRRSSPSPAWLRDAYRAERRPAARRPPLATASSSAPCSAVGAPLFARARRVRRALRRLRRRGLGARRTARGPPGPCSRTSRAPWPGTTGRTGPTAPSPSRAAAAKNAETAALAALLPDPDSRGAGLWRRTRRWSCRPATCAPRRRPGHRPQRRRSRRRLRLLVRRGHRSARRARGAPLPGVHLGDAARRRARPGLVPGHAARARRPELAHGRSPALAERHGSVVTPAVTLASARAARSRGAPAWRRRRGYLFGRHDRSTRHPRASDPAASTSPASTSPATLARLADQPAGQPLVDARPRRRAREGADARRRSPARPRASSPPRRAPRTGCPRSRAAGSARPGSTGTPPARPPRRSARHTSRPSARVMCSRTSPSTIDVDGRQRGAADVADQQLVVVLVQAVGVHVGLPHLEPDHPRDREAGEQLGVGAHARARRPAR